MRAALLIALLTVVPLAAQEPAGADAGWKLLLARASEERKPVVVFFRPPECERCAEFERASVPHPVIQRRLAKVIFGVLPLGAADPTKSWTSAEAGVALFDRTGTFRAAWPVVPDTMTLGIILDSVVEVAPHFERAAAFFEKGDRGRGEIEVSTALTRLGRNTDARLALQRAKDADDPETRQSALLALALLDSRAGNAGSAMAVLREIVAHPVTPAVAGDAWMAIGFVHHAGGAKEEAIDAFRMALSTAPEGSPAHVSASSVLAALTGESRSAQPVIEILRPARQVVSGMERVRTRVGSAAVAHVAFSIDGREVADSRRPPFAARIDFGEVPERHLISVIARDAKGKELGRDELLVNDGGETFSLRLTEPAEGRSGGRVRARASVRVPPARQLRRVAFSWNEAEQAVVTSEPWEAFVTIPEGEVGVLRVVAELDDGRSAEDAVLLNAGGLADRADVQLIELPMTIAGLTAESRLTPDRITVRERRIERRIESVATAVETPLTVGLLIDSSESMQKTLPDVQEAALRFLETSLGPRDRAFIVTFDTHARVVQQATSDVALLREQILAIRPEGLTAVRDAVALGLLQFEGVRGRRGLIVFSDGVDTSSRYSASELDELARRISVPIHLIAATPGAPAALDRNSPPARVRATDRERAAWAEAMESLRDAALFTGGTAHQLDSLAGLGEVFARVADALRAQVIAFVRTDPGTRENEWRTIRVEVSGRGVDVHAPQGYYAPW